MVRKQTLKNIITVDGNIGAGKTTIMKYLHDHDAFQLDLEPVESWQPWLDEIYSNGSGSGSSAFEFQLKVIVDRCCWPNNVTPYPLLIERSPVFQEKVFVTANATNGKITPRQCGLLQDLYAKIHEIWEPEVYVYLRSDPAECAKRIMKRARKSEDAIPLNYLQHLHDLHEEAIEGLHNQNKTIIVIDVEGKTIDAIARELQSRLTSLQV